MSENKIIDARLTISIQYDTSDVSEGFDSKREIVELLEYAAHHLAANGLMSGISALTVDSYAVGVEVDVPLKCTCDHTKAHSVSREYINKDGGSAYSTGHYTEDGEFEPDKGAPLFGGRFDLMDDSDKCAICGTQL